MKKYLTLIFITLFIFTHTKAQFENDTPTEKLGRAVLQGDMDAMKDAMKKGADVNSKNEKGETPLIMAAQGIVLSETPKDVSEIVKFLLDNGSNVNAKDNDGKTALFIVCSEEDMFLPMQQKLKIAEMLLNKGADKEVIANTHGNDEGTPLMYAAMHGDIEMVKLLISEGANVNAKNEYGNTPLIFLVKAGATSVSDYNKAKIIRMLLSKKANPDYKNEREETAISIAKETNQSEILKALNGQAVNIKEPKQFKRNDNGMEYAISPNVQLLQSIGEGDTETVKEALKNGADINFVGELIGPCSPLSLACSGWCTKNNYEIAELLLSNGANPNYPIPIGENSSNALFFATSAATSRYSLSKTAKKSEIADLKKNGLVREDGYETFMKIMELLLKKGSEPDGILYDGMGYTPLMVAAENGSLPAVKLLLKYGANAKIERGGYLELMNCAACGTMGFDNALGIKLGSFMKEAGLAEVMEKNKKAAETELKMQEQRYEEKIKKEYPEWWEEIQKRKKDDEEEAKNNPQKLQNLIGEYTEIVRLLIAKGANVNVSFKGVTPLMQAKSLNATAMINLLKKAGAK